MRKANSFVWIKNAEGVNLAHAADNCGSARGLEDLSKSKRRPFEFLLHVPNGSGRRPSLVGWRLAALVLSTQLVIVRVEKRPLLLVANIDS